MPQIFWSRKKNGYVKIMFRQIMEYSTMDGAQYMCRQLSGHAKLESMSFATKRLKQLCDLKQVISLETLIVLIYEIRLLTSLHDSMLKSFEHIFCGQAQPASYEESESKFNTPSETGSDCTLFESILQVSIIVFLILIPN